MTSKIRQDKITRALKRTVLPFAGILPALLGVLALSSLVTAAVPLQIIAGMMPMEGILGPLFGGLVGSLAVGHPLTSYVIGGELRVAGLGLSTIAAFLVSWVTVGLVQLPAEIASLGLRFTLVRSVFCFISAIVIAYSTALVIGAFE